MEAKDLIGPAIALPGALIGLYLFWQSKREHVSLRFMQRRFFLPERVRDLTAPFGRTPLIDAVTPEDRELFARLRKADYIVTASITNKTRSTLTGVTLVLDDREMICIANVRRPGEKPETSQPEGQLEVGDIKPRATVEMTLWTQSRSYDFRKEFQFHADNGANPRYSIHDPESTFHYHFRVNKFLLGIMSLPVYILAGALLGYALSAIFPGLAKVFGP